MTNKLPILLLRRRPWFIALFQALLVSCSLVFAWLLRFDFSLPDRRILFVALPALVSLRLVVMAYFGLLRGWWKYVGIRDAVDILKAIVAGSVLFWFTMFYLLRVTAFPRTVYLLEAMLTGGLLMGVRLFSRVLAESMREDISSCKRVILIGAGSTAE